MPLTLDDQAVELILRTFIGSVDLAGRALHPFGTYAVSGMGSVRSDAGAVSALTAECR